MSPVMALSKMGCPSGFGQSKAAQRLGEHLHRYELSDVWMFSVVAIGFAQSRKELASKMFVDPLDFMGYTTDVVGRLWVKVGSMPCARYTRLSYRGLVSSRGSAGM